MLQDYQIILTTLIQLSSRERGGERRGGAGGKDVGKLREMQWETSVVWCGLVWPDGLTAWAAVQMDN